MTKNRTWLLVMTGAVFLSLLIGIASCKAPPEPIVMTDVYGFEKLEYTVTDNTTEISLLADTHTLNIEDASDTEAFLSVIHIMEILEREIFELAKAENPMQPLPTSSFHSQETISLDITAINTTDSSKEDYRLQSIWLSSRVFFQATAITSSWNMKQSGQSWPVQCSR